MPEPPASSWPDQLTVKLVEVRRRAGAATLLVGGPESMVLVTTDRWPAAALVSKTTEACWLIGRSRGQAGLGLDGVLDEALADAARVVGRQEAVEDARRGLAGERVERDEGDGQQSGLDVEVQRDQHVQGRAVGVLVADGGLVLRQPGGNGDVDRAEAERAELEGGPVEVRVELLGDGDVLGGGAAVVLELDGVRPGARRLDEALRAVAGGADQGVGVF